MKSLPSRFPMTIRSGILETNVLGIVVLTFSYKARQWTRKVLVSKFWSRSYGLEAVNLAYTRSVYMAS